ncbi:hypothetical protein JL720_1737 [Aureococcus anophagefferens]|nr:hypothetical protein JL720_1737 [Aureococcus anophagefferens]
MADAAWAELCSGESAAKQAAVTKLLRKQEKAKVVEKKRNAVLKKKKKEKKAPAPEVEVPAPEPEPPKPPPPPETAVALLRRLARAIQQLGDERSETRKQGLETIARVVDAPLPEATLEELLHALARPLLLRFEDPVEKHRERAIRVLNGLCGPRAGPDAPHALRLPHAPRPRVARRRAGRGGGHLRLRSRGSRGVQTRQGPGAAGPRVCAFERERTLRTREPSEELRLLLCELLITCTAGRAASVVNAYLHEAMLLLAGFCRDTFGELALKAMEGVKTICATEDLQDPLVPYAAALARVSMPNLRHRHARVRRGAVDAVRRAVAVKHVAKWRAAGSDAIADLVGFREDNVIPTASFYGREVRYNYVAELTRDNNVAVRQALVDCFAEWFTQTLDRRDSQPRLLAYMLNFAIDRDERVRKSALDGLAAAGREMMEESQSRENNIEKIQYGVDGDPRCNHEPAGLPWPLEKRPSLGARTIVRAFTHRVIQPTMDELCSWNEEARTQSAVLLQSMFVYCEEHLTEKLSKIVLALCKALSRCRCEDFGEAHRQRILECGRVLGRYVVPESFVTFLAPRVVGDLEVIPGGVDARSRGDVVDVLEAMLRGCKPAAALPQVCALVDVLTHGSLVETREPGLRASAARAVATLLELCNGRGTAAIEAAFVATGRVESLDRATGALCFALLAWRGGGEHVDDALAALAVLDRSANAALRHAPKLFAGAALDDAEAVDALALFEALTLAAGADRPALLAVLDIATDAACRDVERAVLKQLGVDDDDFGDAPAAAGDAAGPPAAPVAAAIATRRRRWRRRARPCASFKSTDRAKKENALSCLASVAAVVRACVVDAGDEGKRRRLVPFSKRAGPLFPEGSPVAKAAAAAFDTADRLLNRDDERTKRAALDVLWEVLYCLDAKLALLEKFLDALLPHLPEDYPEDYRDDAETQVDALLRAAAVLDVDAFLKAVQDASAAQRTNVLCSLEDHVGMISMMHR